MAGRVAARAKIAGRRYQPLAKQSQPDPIDPDASRQGIRSVSDRLSHLPSPAAVLERLGLALAQNRQEPARDPIPTVTRAAAHENHRIVGLVGIHQQQWRRLVLRFVRTGEHPVQRIVVGGRYRVVLVVMAAGTRDGQPHQAAAHHVDPIVDDVVPVVDETPSQRQEARRRFGGRIVQTVCCQLCQDEPVVGHVLVERLNHPITVGVGMWVVAVLLKHIALGIGIAGHVQPMPTPTLAEVLRIEQPVHRCCVGLVVIGGGKRRQLVSRRR